MMQKSSRPKRPRALQACSVCRTRKNRCSEDLPCTYCVEHDLECTYSRTYCPPKRRRLPTAKNSTSTDPKHMPNTTETALQASPDMHCETATHDENPLRHVPNTLDPETHDQVALPPVPPLNETTYSHSMAPSRNSAPDVMDTNSHTRNLEFYGSSSSVAFLRHVQTISDDQDTSLVSAHTTEKSLATLLHNTGPRSDTAQSTPETLRTADVHSDRFHFRVARRFLHAYFTNIHYIQPLFDEESFFARCEDLWFDRLGKQPLSFIALYYATMSLGSLIMTSEASDISGSDRFTWGRKLFDKASDILMRLGTATDIEMVQCFYMMSKVCQHQLNPHVAYLYSGQAARTSLAIGINRKPVDPDTADPRTSSAASKTWWAVYCLDIQTSFALGRPDSLGPDQYHTQSLPTTAPSDSTTPDLLQIVQCMIELSRLMRRVAVDLYTLPCDTNEKIQRVTTLDADLEAWVGKLPPQLRFDHHHDRPISGSSLKPSRVASYVKKQAVVVQLRYLNLRMVIHAVFMTRTRVTRTDEVIFRTSWCKCLSAAESTIDLMYEIFSAENFFQTWWYNSTYTLFAVSVLLAAVFHKLARTQERLENLFVHVDRAILVLEAMDECVVARNATAMVKRTLARARKAPQQEQVHSTTALTEMSFEHNTIPSPGDMGQQQQGDFSGVDDRTLQQPDDDVTLDDNVDGFDWLNSFPFDDDQQALFWTEWAHELDTLGT